MTWAQFRRWGQDLFGVPVPVNTVRHVVWALGPWGGQTYTGSGIPAEYGLVQQRRYAVWMRLRFLVDKSSQRFWLTAAENHDSGWLVNDGGGVRWLADPEPEVYELLRRGFVAVRCGL